MRRVSVPSSSSRSLSRPASSRASSTRIPSSIRSTGSARRGFTAPTVPKRGYSSPSAPAAAPAVTSAGTPSHAKRRNLGIQYTNHKYPIPILLDRTGMDLLRDPLLNKGTGYDFPERDRLGIRGLVPPRTFDMDEQIERVMARYNHFTTDLDRYTYLTDLQDRNETIFYKILMDNISTMARIVYTPTIGEACLKFGHQYRRPRGMYFSTKDKGLLNSMVYNWPSKEVDVIVMTDGSRILGLGDLGAHGMGIPIGKLSLYVAAAGIHPGRVLPITLDVGTNNQKFLDDPFYLGVKHPRWKGEQYHDFIDEAMAAIVGRWPHALIQFEDFENSSALPILAKFRDNTCCFNDDIQGTGAVALAGVFSALRLQGKKFSSIHEQRIVCVGAGSAGLGVCNAIIQAIHEEGGQNAHSQFYILDKDGLLGKGREGLSPAQKPFVRSDLPDGMDLFNLVKKVKPTMLLGLSGVGGIFKENIIREMSKNCDRPVIFPLSNPTSKAECTAEEAYKWTNGTAIVATGSPFEPVELNGKTYYPSQGNNMYIFPGLGLGIVACRARHVPEEMFSTAARTLAKMTSEEDIANGKIYPDVTRIREVSRQIALDIVNLAIEKKLNKWEIPKNHMDAYMDAMMYTPSYVNLVPNTLQRDQDPRAHLLDNLY